MTNFACLYTATGPSRAPRTERSPRTTAARGVSHFTHGVTGPRQIYGYSLSSCNDNGVDNFSTIYNSLNFSTGELKRIKNKMKKYKKRVKKEDLRYFKAFAFLESLSNPEKSSHVEKTRKKKGVDGSRIMKIPRDNSTSETHAVTKTSTPVNSIRLYRARVIGKTRLRDQLIPRKTSRVPAPSVKLKSISKMKSVGGSEGSYVVPRLAEEMNFNHIVGTTIRLEASRMTSPQSLSSANVP